MKISKIFHFLYFAVLSIPLVSIPIFAIYSQNHEINDNTLTIYESYWENSIKFESNEVNNLQDLVEGNIYYSEQLTLFDDGYHFELDFYYIDTITFNQVNFNEVDEKVIGTYNANDGNFLHFIYDNGYATMMFTNNNCYLSDYYEDPFSFTFFDCEFVITEGLNDFKTYLLSNDLDLPQQSDFKVYEHIYHENTPVTYDDTDIMSQFLYSEYNFMDKYLGIYKYQPFNGIYSWIQNTFFTGNAPLVFTIFYQWFAYWLLVSLFWLIFDVLIYVPMVAHRWLDKGALE